MGYMPSNFKKDEQHKIVMSEEVYNRLAGCINFCGLDMGNKTREAGTVVYGHLLPDGIISLDVASEYDDYNLQARSFSLSPNMIEEEKRKVEEGVYDVICHVHTHPYFLGDMNRMLSQEDIDYYKREAQSHRNSLYLGCMLSISGENKPSQDDISFLNVNSDTGEIINIQDIYVAIDGKPIPLCKETDTYVDQGTNKRYPVVRTLFEMNEDMLTHHGVARR